MENLSSTQSEQLTLKVDIKAIKSTKKSLLTQINFSLPQGHMLIIKGASGAGKSTLLRYIAGLLDEQLEAKGQVYFGKQRLDSLPAHQRRMGLLLQDPLLFAHFSVAQNLNFAAKRRLSEQELQEALHSVGLEHALGKDPAKLSGGEKARLSLLRTLMNQPRALLLDEPFAALDEALKQQIRLLVVEKIKVQRLPALLVSHDPQEFTLMQALMHSYGDGDQDCVTQLELKP